MTITKLIAISILLTLAFLGGIGGSAQATGNPFEDMKFDIVPYAETRIWADGDAEPLWEVGVRTEARVWKNLELYLGVATGQATTEQSKVHGCNIWSGCSLDAMTNTVKEDDTYWSLKGGIQYRFNLLGR